MSPAYMPAFARTNKSLKLVLLSRKLCVKGTLGAYPFPGVSGEAIVALGSSG